MGLDHSFANDLELVLRSPSNTTALVIDNSDGSGNNFCQTLLDDESAGGSIQGVLTGAAPFTGSFRPNAPLAVFDGGVPNGTWQLQAQDFFLADTGTLRAFSLIVTPAVCDAPPLINRVAATKTVAGAFSPGSAVTYTLTLTNTGGLGQADNPGAELTDVLPASLTLVSASASAGTAVADLGANTVTWDGSLGGLGSATVTIVATVNPATGGTVVSNQGALSYDADGNGSNEASTTTDDPATGGANDPTTFVVVAGSFFTVAPCRVLDTRSSAPLAAGDSLIVTVTGGTCGLPTTAAAVSLNATVTQGLGDGFVTLYPADEAPPNTSTLNFSVGQTRANNAVVGLAPDGSLRILNGSGATVHVIVDLNGYFR